KNPVLLVDVATGKQRSGPEGGMELAFSPDGKTLAIAGWAGSLRLWELATGNYLHSFEGPAGVVSRRVAFSPDGKTLASLSADVRLWDIGTGKERWRCLLPGHLIVGIAFSDDSNEL